MGGRGDDQRQVKSRREQSRILRLLWTGADSQTQNDMYTNASNCFPHIFKEDPMKIIGNSFEMRMRSGCKNIFPLFQLY